MWAQVRVGWPPGNLEKSRLAGVGWADTRFSSFFLTAYVPYFKIYDSTENVNYFEMLLH